MDAFLAVKNLFNRKKRGEVINVNAEFRNDYTLATQLTHSNVAVLVHYGKDKRTLTDLGAKEEFVFTSSKDISRFDKPLDGILVCGSFYELPEFLIECRLIAPVMIWRESRTIRDIVYDSIHDEDELL